MHTEHIKELQRQLRLLSLMDDRYLTVDIDGLYGPTTAEAVRVFQEANGLAASAKADEQTLRKLNDVYDDYVQLAADPQAICPFPSPYFVMREGESGTSVSILQAMLNEICADFVAPTPPAVTGHYDAATAACVKRWQAVCSLAENGEVDRFCWDRLADLYNMRLL